VTRVLISTADLIVRAGLESILRASPGLAVVSSSSDITKLATLIEDYSPDVLLIELALHDDELVFEKLSALCPLAGVAVVALIDNLPAGWAIDALRLGVRSLLPRSATAEEIVPTVVAAAAGLVVLHPDVCDSLLPVQSPTRTLPTPPLQALTPREVEVLGMLAEGLGNKGIARRLQISEHTVKFHVSSIFTKLDASSRTEAVALGARQGLIML